MNQGLAKILDSIGKDPGNTVLRDRFLTLVSEMPDGLDKAQNVLNLAILMQEIEPEYSLRLAYFVHQYDRAWIPALQFIADVFTQMLRPGKAEIIQNHIETIKNDKDQTFQPLKTKFPKNLKNELHSQFNAEASIVASIEDYKKKLLVKEEDFSEEYSSYGRFDVNEASVVQKVSGYDDVQRSHSHLFTESARKKDPHKPEFTPTFVLDDESEPKLKGEPKNADRVMSPPPAIPPPKVNLSDRKVAKVKHDVPKFDMADLPSPPKLKSDLKENVLLNPEDVKGFIFDNDDQVNAQEVNGTEFQIERFDAHKKPKNKRESQPKNDMPAQPEHEFESRNQISAQHIHSMERSLKIPEELFDFYWKQGFIEKAEKILIQSEKFAQESLWWQERMLLLSRYTSRSEKGEIDELTLSDEVRNWRVKIKKLMSSGKIRKSYFEIHKALLDASDEDFAIVAYDFLLHVWPSLGLKGFDWKKENGIEGLKHCLSLRSMPTLSVIACGERI